MSLKNPYTKEKNQTEFTTAYKVSEKDYFKITYMEDLVKTYRYLYLVIKQSHFLTTQTVIHRPGPAASRTCRKLLEL